MGLQERVIKKQIQNQKLNKEQMDLLKNILVAAIEEEEYYFPKRDTANDIRVIIKKLKL